MDSTWDALNPFSLVAATPATDSSTDTLGPAPVVGSSPIWHPDNAVFWFGVVAVFAVGLAGLSTHARFGPFKGGFDAGKS